MVAVRTGVDAGRTAQEQGLGAGGGAGLLGWPGESSARALQLLGADRISDTYYSQLADGAFSRSGGASQIAGGRYQIGAGGTGEIDLGITVGGNGQQLLTSVNVQDWYFSGRFNFPTPTFALGGAFSMPLGLFVSGLYEIYILGQGSAGGALSAPGSPTQFYLLLHNGIGSNFVSLGSVGTLGADTCPVGPDAVTFIEMVKRDATLSVYFNRVRSVALTGTPALDNMPGGPGYGFSFGNDAAMAYRIGGLFLARGPI